MSDSTNGLLLAEVELLGVEGTGVEVLDMP